MQGRGLWRHPSRRVCTAVRALAKMHSPSTWAPLSQHWHAAAAALPGQAVKLLKSDCIQSGMTHAMPAAGTLACTSTKYTTTKTRLHGAISPAIAVLNARTGSMICCTKSRALAVHIVSARRCCGLLTGYRTSVSDHQHQTARQAGTFYFIQCGQPDSWSDSHDAVTPLNLSLPYYQYLHRPYRLVIHTSM